MKHLVCEIKIHTLVTAVGEIKNHPNRLKRKEIEENAEPMIEGFEFKFDWEDKDLREN